MNNNVESNTTTTNVVGTRHKKFSIKRWVKKTWAKQKQQKQQRRAADANQLKRTQRQEGTKKSDEEAIGGSGPEVADRSHPLRNDNNNHDEGTSMHDDDLNPHDNQMDVVQRQISHAGPYTESITIENPLCTNKTSQSSCDNPSAAPQHHHDVDAAPTAVAFQRERIVRGSSITANHSRPIPSRQALLPVDPRDFLRGIQRPQQGNHTRVEVLAKHFSPQFTGPIAKVLGAMHIDDDDDESSSSSSSGDADAWK